MDYLQCNDMVKCKYQFISVAQLCLTVCDPMNHSTPGLPVHHQLPEFTQTHVHWVGTSNHFILLSPLLLLPSIFPSIRFFSNESTLFIRWPKYWSFSFNISPSNEHPGLISFRCTLMMYSAYKLNKQGDNIQPWRTPFPNWNQSVVPCPVLTVLPDLHTGFSRDTSGGLVFPSLEEFSTVYCDPHSQRLWHSQ